MGGLMVAHIYTQRNNYFKTEEIIMDRAERLKESLFNWGADYIEEFLGFEYDRDLSKDSIESEMNNVIMQMPDDVFDEYCQKYNIVVSDEEIRNKVSDLGYTFYMDSDGKYCIGNVNDVRKFDTRYELLDDIGL